MVAIYNDRFDLAETLVELGSDPNDGSLYTAVEMRDSTTDQFAFDGSRLRPNHPNKLTALDLISLLLDRGADPYKPFTGQFHSTSMPNSDRFDNSPFFRSAVASDVEALKVFIAHKIDLDKTSHVVPVAAAADEGAAPAARPAGGRGRGKSQCRPNRDHGDDDRWPRAADDRRSGIHPLRRRAVSRTRKPEARRRFRRTAQGRRKSECERLPTASRSCTGRSGRQSRHDQRSAEAGVKFDQPNNDGLDGARRCGRQTTRRCSAARGLAAVVAPPPAARRRRGRGGRGGGTTPQDVAKLLRELMGLPPAPPAPRRTCSVDGSHLRGWRTSNEEALLAATALSLTFLGLSAGLAAQQTPD